MMRDKESDHRPMRDDDNIARWSITENLADSRVKPSARLASCLLSETQLVRVGKEVSNGAVKMLSWEIGGLRAVVLM